MRVGVSGLAIAHPAGLGRLSRTYLLALAKAAPDWEIYVYLRSRSHLRHLADEAAAEFSGAPVNVIPHFPPIPGANRLLLEEIDLPRQFSKLELDAYLGCDFTLPPRAVAARELVVIPDLLPFTRPRTLGWRARLLYRHGIRRSISRQAALLCISRHTLATFERLFPDNQCETHVIRPALSPRLISLAHRQHTSDVPLQVRGSLHAVSSPGPYLLSVGVSGPRKNTALLVSQHLRLVLDGAYKGSLILVGGDGQYHTAPREQKLAYGTVHRLPQPAHSNPPAVYDIGYVSDSELSQLYSRADLLVSLSTEEGFGYPVLEALAHGTPAIVTEKTPMVDIAAGGVVTSSLDPNIGYERIKSALNCLPALRQEAAAVSIEDFSLERLGRELRAAIQGE